MNEHLQEMLTYFEGTEAARILEAACHYRDGMITSEEMVAKIDRANVEARKSK